MKLDWDGAGSTLTPRERQVVESLSEGSSSAAIGTLLGISENTVKFHLKGIFRKLHAKNRTQVLTRLAPRE